MLKISTQGEALEAIREYKVYVQEIPEHLMDYNLSVVCNNMYRNSTYGMRINIVPRVYQNLFGSSTLHLLINML